MIKKTLSIRLSLAFVGTFLLIAGGATLVWQAGRTTPLDFVSNEVYTNQDVTHLNDFSQNVYIDPAHCLVIDTMEAQVANLQKLAMVWGFTKYTHLAFLAGERCWDKELLNLIPIVRFAAPEDVNDILYNWFVGLGDDGFDNNGSVFLLAPLNEVLPELGIWDVVDFEDMIKSVDWISKITYKAGVYSTSAVLRADKSQLDTLPYDDEAFSWLHLLEVKDKECIGPLSDMDWLTDESFLGDALVSRFSHFNEVPIIDRTGAPVLFSSYGFSNFSNQNLHPDMDFQDGGYRLLGLFRLWNAMKYFSPYINIIDDDWRGLLLKYIPMMLEGADRLSYELTLMSLASHLHDAHVYFVSALGSGRHERFDNIFGGFVPPIIFTEAEGRFVVLRQLFIPRYEHKLMPGDAILKVNGVDINEIIAEKLKYVSYPNEDKAIFYLTGYMILRQKTGYEPMEVYVLRDNTEIRIEVETVNRQQYQSLFFTGLRPATAYERLQNNIGLINPSRLSSGSTQHIMEYFADTSGLIVDLRQRPGEGSFHRLLANYLIGEPKLFFRLTKPSQSIPGVFKELQRGYSGGGWWFGSEAYFYNNPVVLLMDERTFSFGESSIMSLRNGANVTVVGSNSMGANGDIVQLPLPGGITMAFSGIGVFTHDGEQTQRIGLSPDIRVERTIAGIRDGRDELLEAAIEYLISPHS